VRAVNLIPRDARRSGISPSLGKLGVAHFVVGLMVVALAFVTVYVLTNNTVSQRKSQLASLKQQVSNMQAQVARLNSYEQFEKLAQARAATVRQIASTRFDWHGALSDLSKVVPANTSLQSLVATVSSTASAGGGSSSGSGGAVRSAIDAPAFELKGCTGTQDEVAQLMSRLRLINGVMRVTLEDSSKGSAAAPGTTSSSAGPSGAGCPAKGPTFDMVVFFQPVAGALAPSTGAPTTAGGVK
jgi:Tfp pilus assembly protein PilN